jgi:hypothetical protein
MHLEFCKVKEIVNEQKRLKVCTMTHSKAEVIKMSRKTKVLWTD